MSNISTHQIKSEFLKSFKSIGMKIFYLLIFSSIVLSQPQGRQVMELAKKQIQPKDLVSTISMTLIKNLHGKEKSREQKSSHN